MKLSGGTINAIGYFFRGKGLDRWSGWEREREVILQELPLLGMYRDKEQELFELGEAVKQALKAYTDARSYEWEKGE